MTATSEGFPEPGDQLGPFRLAERLGVGGMGVVYEALDTHLHRQVALKIIAPHLAQDESFRARFTREARAQASLDSPHVVQVFSFGESEGRLYIASQLIPDGDLGQMLHAHGLPPARVALHLMSQVAAGLVDAHAAGLVHRDIKPANVLLRHRDHSLTAYLADFGIARQVSSEADPAGTGAPITRAGAAVGTPSYMAPELHTGGEAGPACDLYSLGCVLWTALSGSAPYAGGTDYQVVSGHVSGPIPQVEVTGPLGAEINRVLSLALAKDPARRYPSAAALRDDLKRVARLPDDARPIRAAASAGGAPLPSPPPPPTQSRQFYASAPPTPTPSPRPVSQAPPAPSLARPSTPSSGRPGRGSRARRWVPILVGAAVLAIGAGVLVAVLNGGGSDPGGPSGSGASDSSGGTTRADDAIEILSRAFATVANVDEEAGACIARSVVDDIGVDGLIEAGVIDEELNVLDDDLQDSEVKSALFSATIGCADFGG